eukprot:COSAG05_NODE_22978_length_261_cov_0.629630_1_plen_48_part_01
MTTVASAALALALVATISIDFRRRGASFSRARRSNKPHARYAVSDWPN